MAENNRTFSVSVTTSSPANLPVVPGQVQNAITATGDVAQYYANIARQWAISNELVLHEDYSSKYYAGQSKEQAALASDYSEMCAQYLSNFNEQIQDYNETFQTTLTEALADVTSAKTDAVNSIETLETSAIDNITDTTDTCTSAISTAVTNATATVNNNISTAQTNLTSFITTNINNAQNTIDTAVDTAEESITSTVTTAQSTINSTAETAIDNIQAVADEQYVDGVTFHQDADVVDLEIVNPTPNWGDIQGTLSNQTDLQNALDSKVDKVEGKSLISDSEISRLADVTNYDDTEIKADIAQAEADIDNLETNKQDKLTAGEGISIVGDIISCTVEGGGGGSVDIVTTISASSTDEQVPSAKCMWDLIGNVETLLSEV